MSSTSTSALHPIDPSTVSETEHESPWIVRKLVGSITGRVVIASLESLRAAGTSVVCLSPWGDSVPLLLPCIRFRDLVVHTVVVATGGTAAIAAPVMGSIATEVVGSLGSSILVEATLHTGFELSIKVADDLLIDKPIDRLIPKHSLRLQTTSVKKLLITLKFKHNPFANDAALGFFRSPVHADPSLFASVVDYLSIQKGWFSPYLFASGRRPLIPRHVKPDVIFCHGQFLNGDYNIGETLLAESAAIIKFCVDPPPKPPAPPEQNMFSKFLHTSPPDSKTGTPPEATSSGASQLHHRVSTRVHDFLSHLPVVDRMVSRSPSPEPGAQTGKSNTSEAGPPLEKTMSTVSVTSTLTTTSTSTLPAEPLPPPPRRMVITVLGIAPHRIGLWTSSNRPGESLMHYFLFNGCPTVVVPVKHGCPLIGWDTLTLAGLQSLQGGVDGKKFDGVVEVLFEYVSLCVDWDRVVVPVEEPSALSEEEKKTKAVKDAIGLIVASAVRSGESKQVKKEVDVDRAGIVMFRIP